MNGPRISRINNNNNKIDTTLYQSSKPAYEDMAYALRRNGCCLWKWHTSPRRCYLKSISYSLNLWAFTTFFCWGDGISVDSTHM